jgi:tetratricopeptide (TPR) repeat protein
MKRAARLPETAPAATPPPAPALAAPWPASTPPVFPQDATTTGGARKRGERAEATKPASAAAKPAAAGAPAGASESPAPAAAPAAPATAEAPAAAAAPTTTPQTRQSAEAILARGQAAFDRGNYAEAIRRAKEATAIGAAVPGHLLIADSYYHLQRYADALREYEATLALEPSNALAKRGRELSTKAAAESTR